MTAAPDTACLHVIITVPHPHKATRDQVKWSVLHALDAVPAYRGRARIRFANEEWQENVRSNATPTDETALPATSTMPPAGSACLFCGGAGCDSCF